ncbi:DUF7144 family membrane protein [Streptomyces sp. 1222.5]|uniref:DUF7144 family membrane protein n=1 Tax=Streptomyces sp. 1222.5 TaxID=1881026 RepID=UPI003EC0BE76
MHRHVTESTAFAAIMLATAGTLDTLRGFMCIAEDEVFKKGTSYLFAFSLVGWGWIHIALGVVTALAGITILLTDLFWARAFGVVAAFLSIVANFLSLPYYPIWSIIVIAMCSVSIRALCLMRAGMAH